MKLLVTDKIDEHGLGPLKKHFQIDYRAGVGKKKLKKIIGDYDCVITRSSTALPKELIEKAKELKIIGRSAIGVDNIDIFAATARKIAVINAPKGNSKVTAEHTIGLLFALLRHIPQANNDLKKGIWGKQKYIGTQIAGKTLGIVGFGNVGREVYRIAKGCGMKVVVCEPYIRLPKKVEKVTFEELLKISDIITFHVPLTYLTRGMINKHTLSLCKKGVYIINCSRGGVVDEEAVYQALVMGNIAGFAVDVFPHESDVNEKLLALPNVIATPHIAGSTFESQKQSISEVVSGICEYLGGRPPTNLLNPQVFKKKDVPKRRIKMGFEVVVFDCDSTLSAIEGIDELAALVGKREKVAKLTRDAMEGKIAFEEVFQKRLELIKPSRDHLLRLSEVYIDNLIPDAKGVIEALQHLGIEVFIVSNGYTPVLLSLGERLGIPGKNIFGNDLLFDEKGSYQTFIEGPLRRNHGKLQIIRQIKGKKMMVGDGITDLEVAECVDLFVGFGGVVKRPIVEKESEIYLYSKSLSSVLVIAAGTDGCTKLLPTKYRRYVGKGIDLLSHALHVRVNNKKTLKFSEFAQLAYY